MELKINKGEFAGMLSGGKKYDRIIVRYNDGAVTLEAYTVTRANVPFETVEPATENEFPFGAVAIVDASTVRGAAEYVRVNKWTANEKPEESPAAPVAEFAVNFDGMKETVKYLREYASEDEGRPNLCGVHFANKGTDLDVVAVNGAILCWDKAENTVDNPGGEFAVTVSNACLDAALKLVGKKGNLGTMRVKAFKLEKFWNGETPKGDAVVTFDGLPGYEFRGTTGLDYPEFRKVIPAETTNPMDFTADRESLMGFAKVARKAAKKSKAPLVTIIPAVGGLLPTFRDGNMETVSCETLAIPETPDAWTGMKIAYNAEYLFTILSGFVGEKVRFCVKGEATATSIREGNRVAVLMPVRL